MQHKDPRPTGATASIWEGAHCRECGWPVIFACCNDGMVNWKGENWDWWVYCSNKSCANHDGEGKWQDVPKWIHER